MARYRLYADRNDWQAGKVADRVDGLANAKARAAEIGATLIEKLADGRTLYWCVNAWFRA